MSTSSYDGVPELTDVDGVVDNDDDDDDVVGILSKSLLSVSSSIMFKDTGASGNTSVLSEDEVETSGTCVLPLDCSIELELSDSLLIAD
jgi:hypothetical protein